MATAPCVSIEVLTPGQMKDLFSAAGQGVSSKLPRIIAEAWLGQKGMLGEKISEILSAGPFPDINWPLTYEKLDMKVEYERAVASGKLVFPSADPRFWFVPMIHDEETKVSATPNRVVAAYRKLEVNVWTYRDDLDADVTQNDRDPRRDGSYVVGFKRTIEADEENKNLSADMLAVRKYKGIVLCERLVLGFGYFVTTGQHLDVKIATLCSGSRYVDGDVPDVRWDPGNRKVYVCWFRPGGSGGDLRSRSVQFPLPA